MAFEQGNSIKVTVGSTLIGGQQGCSLNMETETSETTTKDSGVWAESEATGLSWSVDCDGLEALEEAWRTLAKVTVKYGTPEKYKTGQAVITSLSQNSPSKEKTTYSVSLQGVGELTKNQ